MANYSVVLPNVDKQIAKGKLGHLHAENQYGRSFGFTDFYMEWDGAPSLPIFGEFHFSRFSYLYWEEELRKMKAGGVRVVATYVFWNYHEEEEGIFNWGENRNLRHFIDLCAKVDISIIVRIGPFCHGEVRNGGIPDWVFDKPLEIRSNDELYLSYTKRLYREISKQLEGQYFHNGGPIIGIQLENEFMHCGAPMDSWAYKAGKFMSIGTGATEHLNMLKVIAREEGINPEFFTATAWGGAAVPEEDTLPMLAGYAYTPWIPNQPPSQEYIFRDLHYKPFEPVNYDSTQYPVTYCEMAGGMQVSYTARPWVSADSVEAMTLVKLASGSNILGYYMYHGGTNPVGKHGYLNEYGLPKLTYDYQSPLGEFGRVGETYDRIKLLSLFLESYGELLAPMGTVLPEGQSEITPENIDELRWAIRQSSGSGFVFLNNFQDHVEMKTHEGVEISISSSKGDVRLPSQGSLTIEPNISAILPFHLDVAGIHINSATVQPITFIEYANESILVFYAAKGLSPELILDASSIATITLNTSQVTQNEDSYTIVPTTGMSYSTVLTTTESKKVVIIVLTREEALNLNKVTLFNKTYLALSNSRLHVKNDQLVSTSEGSENWQVSLYPHPTSVARLDKVEVPLSETGIFKQYTLTNNAFDAEAHLTTLKEHYYQISQQKKWPTEVNDVFLVIDYTGDVAALYLDKTMITDHIHYGDVWRVGLKQYESKLASEAFQISITPIRQGKTETFVNQALVERFEGIEIGQINSVQAVTHYRNVLLVK